MNQHDQVLAELDRQIDLLSSDVLCEVPSLNLHDYNLESSIKPVEPTPINNSNEQDMSGILFALENCQLKIKELEKDKSESANQISQLRQELNSARQLLFYKSVSDQPSQSSNVNEPLEKLFPEYKWKYKKN